jgi:hypothetical protein
LYLRHHKGTKRRQFVVMIIDSVGCTSGLR